MGWENRSPVPIKLPLAEAVALACKRSGKQPAEVMSARYFSTLQQQGAAKERGEAQADVPPKALWQIEFVGEEWLDQADGAYGLTIRRNDVIIVFEDGQVTTLDEYQQRHT